MEWEQRRLAGQPLSAEELCRDRPELLVDLKRRIAALLSLDPMLQSGTVGQEQASTGHHGDTSDNGSWVPPTAEDMGASTRYTVLRPHARGGLGEVVLARDEALQRTVALKRMQVAPHHDSARRQRFLREAEITSQLDHPGIVPVLGIGEDEHQSPYYAMRFVAGETLERAIAVHHQSAAGTSSEHHSLRQLLGRFVSVCNTVAFAHSRGVIHRDLKPANVMTGEFGETLVVDWGLAKRLSEPVEQAAEPKDLAATTSSTFLTAEGAALGTPAFMSPEQALGKGDEVGIASDIYSLGATLYALLTGVAPFGMDQLPGYLDRIHRGEFPHPRQVRPNVPLALEAICLKAMARRPEDRYRTALDMASDVENWLADEPTSVWRESWGTRLWRWGKRHRTLVSALAAGCCVALLGSLGLVMLTRGAKERLRVVSEQEQTARRTADANAATATFHATQADEQSELALRSLQAVTFEIQRELARIPAAHTVRRQLLNTALKGLGEIAATFERRSEVDLGQMTAHRDLGEIFLEVGDLQGGSGTSAARTQFERARDIAERLVAVQPDDINVQRQLPICLDRLADVELRDGQHSAAREYYEQSLQMRTRLLSVAPQDSRVQRDIAVSHNRLGDLALAGGKTEEARTHFLASIACRETIDESKAGNEADRDQMVSYNKLGEVTLRLGDAREAERIFEQGLAIGRRLQQASPSDVVTRRDVATSLSKLGDTSWTLGDYPRAREFYTESLALSDRLLADDQANLQYQQDVAQSLQSMADVERKLLNKDQSNEYARRMVSMLEQIVVADPQNRRVLRDLAQGYSTLAEQYLDRQEFPTAIELLHKALEIRRQRAAADPSDSRGPSDVAASMTKLGDGLLAAGRTAEAQDLYQQALQIHQQRCAANPTDHRAHYNLAAFHQRIGVSCRRKGQWDAAHTHYESAMRIATDLAARDPSNMQVQTLIIGLHDALGLLEQARDRTDPARQHFERGIALARELIAAGKLTGEDATWDQYIAEHLQALPPPK